MENWNCDGRVMNELTCLKAYEVLGELGVSLNDRISYRVGCTAVHSKTGHSFIKRAMRENSAVYGVQIDEADRVSLNFGDWWLNVRAV